MRTEILSINQAQRQKRLGEKLRQARKDCGLNQGDVGLILRLSEAFGRSGTGHQPNLSRIEKGRRKLWVLELEEFARLYGKPLEFFTTWGPDDEKQLQDSIARRARVLGHSAEEAAKVKGSRTQRPATLRRRREKLVACLTALCGDNFQEHD